MFRASRLAVAQGQAQAPGLFEQTQIALGRGPAQAGASGDLVGGQRVVGVVQDVADQFRCRHRVAARQPGAQRGEDPVYLLLVLRRRPRARGVRGPVHRAPQRRVRVELGTQPREGERLHQIVQGAVAHRGLDGRHIARRRHHDHVGVVAPLAHPAHQAEPGLVGQEVVEQDQIDPVAL